MTQNEEKIFAKESEQTKRAREKLKIKLKNIEKNASEESLEKKIKEIHIWISKYASKRIVLEDKKFSFFDENRNTAKLSKCVCDILESLKEDLFKLNS